MSDDGRFGGSAPRPTRPADDFGFFTKPAVPAPSHFGGAPARPASAPAAVPAAAPAAPAYLPPVVAVQATPVPVAQQPPNQFGPPPGALDQPWQPGPPMAPGQPYASTPRRGLPVWAIVAICVPVGFAFLGILAAIAIPVFLNQRNTPVMPDTVRGVAKSTDPGLTQIAVQVRRGLLRDNPGSKIDVAGYGAAGSGYIVVGANLRINPAQEFGSLGNSSPATSYGAIQCASNDANSVSLCLRVGTRGSVEVMATGGGGSDLSELAIETSKVWAAQPYGK